MYASGPPRQAYPQITQIVQENLCNLWIDHSLRTRRAEALDDFVAVGAGGGFDGGFIEG